MNTELLACRAELSKALQELESRRELGRIDQRRIDEARAIARRLAFELSEHIHPADMSCVDRLLAAFDALPWAKDDA